MLYFDFKTYNFKLYYFWCYFNFMIWLFPYIIRDIACKCDRVSLLIVENAEQKWWHFEQRAFQSLVNWCSSDIWNIFLLCQVELEFIIYDRLLTAQSLVSPVISNVPCNN